MRWFSTISFIFVWTQHLYEYIAAHAFRLSPKRIGRPVLALSKSSRSIDGVEVASVSLAGVAPDRTKINQDACFHFAVDRFVCCGVLDGHGKRGHELNAFLQSRMPTILEEKLRVEAENKSIKQILVETFEESHYFARMDADVPAGRSGTTCVVTILDMESADVYTGNVGDSRAIVGMQQDSGWVVKALSEETTVARLEERERIEQGEGRIDSAGNVWYGPVGIAMTRALGDSVMTRAGVIPTPEVTKLNLIREFDAASECATSLIVLGTDGIFDVMANEDAIKFIDEALKDVSLEKSCSGLVHEARKRWQGGLPLEVQIDDTTSVVLSIRFSN